MHNFSCNTSSYYPRGCAPRAITASYCPQKVVQYLYNMLLYEYVMEILTVSVTLLQFRFLDFNHKDVLTLLTWKLLLQVNANVNVANQRGNTPLHEAARWNYFPIVKLLIDNKANVNCRSHQHLTPAQLAQVSYFSNISIF